MSVIHIPTSHSDINIFKKHFLRPLIILILSIFAFISGIMVNCGKHEMYIKYKNLFKEEEEYTVLLMSQTKWFMSGYIEVYQPGRYLFNGTENSFYNEIAAHPFLPIGTKLYIKNMTRNTNYILPVLDRKANIGDRQILMISRVAAEMLDWHYDDHFIMYIIDLPPAYAEDTWFNLRAQEKLQRLITNKLRRRGRW